MKCYYCGARLDSTDTCPGCETDIRVWKRIVSISNILYNEALTKARVRDLSGAIQSLKLSLRYNKMNIEARNLLGLIYYETGEVVSALSEWVISKSYQPEENQASRYLSAVQKNPTQLSNADQTIRKYNQALRYCREENYDLALIQIKKVVSANPKIVKGYQLLALLSMREERYDLAMRALRTAKQIDVTNTLTLRYLQECREHMKANGKGKRKRKKEKEPETITYVSGNEIIIRPTKFTENFALRTVINLLIGCAIGIAVVCFLIIPEVQQEANSSAAEQVVEANQNVSSLEQTITSLEEQITSLNEQLSEAQSATDSADEKTAAYSQLLEAYTLYAAENYSDAAEALTAVDQDLLDESAQSVYDSMLEDVLDAVLEDYYYDGMKLYQNSDYEGAIECFLFIEETDPGYNNGEIAFYLAFAYNYSKDYENALKWFYITLEETTDSDMLSTSTSMSEDLVNRGYTAAE